MRLKLAVLLIFFLPILAQAHQALTHSVVIHMSESGYDPAEIKIKPGTTVVFENSGTEDHWPASDNHPSHTLYDDTSLDEHCNQQDQVTFDACSSIHPGESWSFSFSKEGVFTYHDHLWPHLTGTIQVTNETKSSFLKKLGSLVVTANDIFLRALFPGLLPVAKVQNDVPNAQLTPAERYTKLVATTDPSWAIKALMAEAASSSQIADSCHEILHEIGQTAYYQYGDFSAASVFSSSYCNSGYIHGVFEEYFGDKQSDFTQLSQLCQQYTGENSRSFDYWQCYHGIGHGFMYLTGGDLNQSLDNCQNYLEDEKSVKQCQNGVYMEIFNSEQLAKETDYLTAESPMTICNERDTAQADCYSYLPTYYAQVMNIDYIDMFALCDEAPGVHTDSCKLGIGAEAMKRSMNDPNSALAMCGQATFLRDQTTCAAGAISMYVNQTGSIEAARDFCQSLDGTFLVTCNEVTKWRASEF